MSTKKDLQKKYRDREKESIDTIRGLIKDLTGEEPQKRQEVLEKATEVLSSELEDGGA